MHSLRRWAVLASLGAAVAAPAPALAQRDLLAADSTIARVAFEEHGLMMRAPDGFSYLGIRFRVQQWGVVSTDDHGPEIESTLLAVRRARLRLESVLVDPRLKVNFQFSFSRGDQDFENSNFPNVLRDAYVTWQATPSFSVASGQMKLPGNRQRVNSSSELQFPDRSIVNGAFTIDRDVGVIATYRRRATAVPFALRAAISGGEGRNAGTGDAGLAYTARAEFHPLGAFADGGDYYEGDLAREPHPRLAVGATISHNEHAVRSGGQLGKRLFAPRDITTGFADVLFKYRGFAASAEYARRLARDPVTTDGTDSLFVLTGHGVTVQASYLTRAMIEPAVRLSVVQPHRDLAGLLGGERQRETSLGLTRYVDSHRVKFQLEALRDDFYDSVSRARRHRWSLRTSLEVGI